MVESLDEQTLLIEIGKAYGAVQLVHTLASTPFCYGVKKSLEYLVIINEIKPAEAALLDIPRLIGAMVDDAHDATNYFTITVCHIGNIFAHLECGIFLGIKGIDLVKEYRRAVVRIALVEVDAELHKLAQLTL